MHDIWNPWHGCIKCSEGCQNCYMYYLDSLRDKDGSNIYRTKTGFKYPLSKDRQGNYKVKSGEMLRVCMTSDFFLEEADDWRDEAWSIIERRPDVKFFLLTKRPDRVAEHLPFNWGGGWENVFFNVTCENQKRTDERIPILLELPFKHKGIMCAPFIGPVSISNYLKYGQIEQVLCDGENYGGARPCHYEWVKSLRDECEMEFAKLSDETEIINLYKEVIEIVNLTEVRLGWNIDIYPDATFINSAISNDEMCVIRDDGRIVAAAVLNHSVNPEYADINWEIKGPNDRLATIHALAVLPQKQGSKTSYQMLSDIEDYCRKSGDLAIHLDVIDTNIPAYKLYTRNGYKEVDRIKMFYEVVGTREFWMFERVL